MNIVKTLLKAGADINPFGEYLTPLIAAIKGKHFSVVKELLEAGADVNLKDEFDTPLTAACGRGHVIVVKELLQKGADVNLQCERDTPMTAACGEGQTSIVAELLKAGADVNLQGEDDKPLTAACYRGHTSIVTELLKAGADVNLHDTYDTPLTAACKNGFMNIAKKLLEAGSDVNMQDKEGNTPLYKALISIHKTFIPVILQMFNHYGADSTINNNIGISAFYIALIRKKIGSVKQLLGTKNESQLNKLRLHLFECLVNIRHSDVMTDSKDDVVMTRRQVWCMERRGDLYKSIIESDCKGLKHLVCVDLGVNQ